MESGREREVFVLPWLLGQPWMFTADFLQSLYFTGCET